jgi:tetratricopeptide (TPR) repeat protein
VSQLIVRFKPSLGIAVALVVFWSVAFGGSGTFAQGAAQTPPSPTVPAQKPPTCENYLLLGKLYFSNGQFDSAYIAFSLCLKLEPRNVEALYSLGRVEIRLQLYSAAITHLKDCIGIESKNVSCYVALSQAYSTQFADSSDRKAVASQLDEGLRVLDDAERVATAGDDKAKIYNQRGTIYNYKKEYEKSLEAYKKALGFKPDDSIILFNLGALQLQTATSKEQIQTAVDTLRRAVDVSPRDAITRAYYARALRTAGDIKSCVSESTQAYNLSGGTRSKNAFVVGQYGICLYVNKNLVAARTALEQAVKIDTRVQYGENFFYLGRAYLDGSQTKDARALFTQATAIDPTDETYWYWLGQANEKGGDKDAACKSYAQAIKVKQGYEDATRALGALKCPTTPGAR